MSLRRCCGLVVSVPASRLPVLGSNLSPGPPHSAVCIVRTDTVPSLLSEY